MVSGGRRWAAMDLMEGGRCGAVPQRELELRRGCGLWLGECSRSLVTPQSLTASAIRQFLSAYQMLLCCTRQGQLNLTGSGWHLYFFF